MDDAVRALEAAGLKVARQSKQQELGDQPAYAWLAGLTTLCCNPDDDYEWFGVLREVFGLDDDLLAREKLRRGRFEWENPETHPEPLRTALESLRPSVQTVDDESVQLDVWCENLVALCGLEAKAAALDSGGATLRELARLRAEARVRAVEGLSPRDWAVKLASDRRSGRTESRSEPDAITVQTCHSAKGLEWPVVLVPGLWREIGFDHGRGLQVLRDADGSAVSYLKAEDIPDDTKEARERERRRELVRLLYVTLTRPQRALLLPWDSAMTKAHEQSFVSLWLSDIDEMNQVHPAGALADSFVKDFELESLGVVDRAMIETRDLNMVPESSSKVSYEFSLRLSAGWERRVLPHELAEHQIDGPRLAKHESSAESPASYGSNGDPITYGLWWHETLEFVPWLAPDLEVTAHGENRCMVAEQAGFGSRAKKEWNLLRVSEIWKKLRSERWNRISELAVFAPLSVGWMDGVMDLVVHDAQAKEVWVLDWKTNRQQDTESLNTFMKRIKEQYSPQLRVYGRSLRAMFSDSDVTALIYCTNNGCLIEVEL
jgi:ATP-dependent exoDNAse (exonuclease V) beta subunit